MYTGRSARDSGCARRVQRRRRRQGDAIPRSKAIVAAVLLASGAQLAAAQDTCVSLAESTQCSAFSSASVSTDSDLTGLFPFLSLVTDVASFDTQIQTYINADFAQLRYGELIGCSEFDSDNTTAYYARYTTSVLCNALVQNSITSCSLSGEATRPLCADSCATYAQSEQEITASNICGDTGENALRQIRADFVNCALPANALADQCIPAVENEPSNCGFFSNMGSLCSFCADSTQNATDSCCVFSNTTARCEGVTLPVVASSSLPAVTVTSLPPSASSRATDEAAAGSGLTGGQIAGIVVGVVLGLLLLIGLIIGGCVLLRRRRGSSPASSVFNQSPPPRPGPTPPKQMAYNDGTRDQERAGLAVVPGARVARMSALEGSPNGDHRKASYSDEEEASPESREDGMLPPAPKRTGSLCSSSRLAAFPGADDTSPSSNEYTSPESRGQSEQLSFFKDYYSQDEIRSGDLVSTLWAYEPRAADEFALERGDMIKVLGIWDDGWATGVRVRSRAEDWFADSSQRDSGMSNAGQQHLEPREDEGEVKAFPLVCVCVPRHWRKTIEGESTEGSGPGGYPD